MGVRCHTGREREMPGFDGVAPVVNAHDHSFKSFLAFAFISVFFFRPRPILSGPTYAGGLGFPAVLRVPKPNRFQHGGRIRRAEQIIRRRTAIRVPPVPEVERQAGQATAPAGLPTFVQPLRPDHIVPKIIDILDVMPGVPADAHGVEESLVVGIQAAGLSEALFVEFLVFSVFEFDRHFVPPYLVVQ